jgi:ComF family protein
LRIVHHGFKFEGLQGLAVRMAARIAAQVPKPIAGCLVPVPVFSIKERERGYNPAYDLAMALSGHWGLPVQKLLGKTRNTPAQMSLSQKERAKNPRGAFATQLGGKVPANVVLVDDVLTTGATLDECARVLKKAGAYRVDAVVWGRTPKNFSMR